MDEKAANALIDWLVDSSLNGASEGDLLRGLCDRLVDAGLPLTRAMSGSGLLHPTIDSRGYIWKRGAGTEREEYSRESTGEGWVKSPFYRLWAGNEKSLRRRLDDEYQIGEFELLDRLKIEGATDYLATINRHTDPSVNGKMGDFVSSWAIDRPGGFADAELAQMDRIVAAFALGHQWRAIHGTMRVLLETYLGQGAAQRVLEGNVVRGQADTIRTVIWYSDLVNFTRIADEVERDQLLHMLNAYAACLVEAIEANDGEVLKFIGDGILAIFSEEDPSKASAQALDAAKMARKRVAALNAACSADGLRTTDFYLALHFGDLLFGNYGSATRLDFTVLGPAVNEASRMGAMSRSLDQWAIVSSVFANAAGPRRADLVSLGRYALRGVGQPQELFTIEQTAP
jgi:adenylate cyclase